MSKNGKLEWDNNFGGTPDNIDPQAFPNMQQVANYVYNALHLYLSGQHAQQCPTCNGHTPGIPPSLILTMATAINGILEALEKGVPVTDGKVILNKAVFEEILHPPEPRKERIN